MAIVVLGLIAVPPATAASITLNPSADAQVAADAPSTNFGAATTLRVDGSPVRRSYVRFDVSLPADAQVTRTTLRLFFTESASAGYSIKLASTNSWSEGSITYANAPAFGGTIASGSSIAAGWNSVIVPNVSTGAVTYVLTRSNKRERDAHSRENTNKPQLVVEYTTGAPPPPTTDPVIAAAGDIACSPADANYNGGLGTATACRQKYTSDLLVNSGLSAVLALGDLQYNSGSLSDFNTVYHPSWGRAKSITRPALGNHEYGSSGAAGYFDYFNGAGVTSGPAGDRGSGYYSFDVGSWHLIALNSNCSRVSCAAGSAQETWLRADLATHPNMCTAAYWHHPRFSSGHDGDGTFMQPLWQDLYDAGADLALVGHSHDYERFAPQDAAGNFNSTQGIRQFVVGTGGAFFTGMSTVKPNSEVRQNNTFGVLRLTLRTTGFDWRFVAESGKLFSDSGSGSCHGPPSGQPPPPPTGAVTFAPEADAPVQEANPTTNYGTAALRADGGADPDVDSYLRFTTSNLLGSVQSAKLRLFATTGTANGPAVYSTTNAWTETGLTWSNRPARTSVAWDDKGSIASGTWVEYDVTPFVTGNGTFSFALGTTSSDGIDFYSREGTTKPQLVVTSGT